MAIDNYTANKSFIFEHKEQAPRRINFFNLLFAISTIIMIFVFVPLLWLKTHEYSFTKEQLTILYIFFAIWMLLAVLAIILNCRVERFNFYYIVTVDEDIFSISSPVKGGILTEHFPRQIEYQFKEKSRLVYMRDDFGHRIGFRYDEPFRKFLEEIQIK